MLTDANRQTIPFSEGSGALGPPLRPGSPGVTGGLGDVGTFPPPPLPPATTQMPATLTRHADVEEAPEQLAVPSSSPHPTSVIVQVP